MVVGFTMMASLLSRVWGCKPKPAKFVQLVKIGGYSQSIPAKMENQKVDLAVFRDRPIPMEGLATLPIELDGSQGENRSLSDGCQIQAENDWRAIQCWLEEFEGSPQTTRAYRREAERLLLWSCSTAAQIPLQFTAGGFPGLPTVPGKSTTCDLLVREPCTAALPHLVTI